MDLSVDGLVAVDNVGGWLGVDGALAGVRHQMNTLKMLSPRVARILLYSCSAGRSNQQRATLRGSTRRLARGCC